jgi:hypothetical protein
MSYLNQTPLAPLLATDYRDKKMHRLQTNKWFNEACLLYTKACICMLCVLCM